MLLWDGGLIKVEICSKGNKLCHNGMIEQFFMDEGELMSIGADGFIKVRFFVKFHCQIQRFLVKRLLFYQILFSRVLYKGRIFWGKYAPPLGSLHTSLKCSVPSPRIFAPPLINVSFSKYLTLIDWTRWKQYVLCNRDCQHTVSRATQSISILL